jgi:hypothetical protein
MKFLSSFDLSSLSAGSVRVLEACIDAASGNGFDFGCGDEIAPALASELNAKQVGGHMADLVAKGFISGEHIRVNDEGPRFLQFDLRADLKDAAMRYDWRLDQYAEELESCTPEALAAMEARNAADDAKANASAARAEKVARENEVKVLGEMADAKAACPCVEVTSEGETCGDCNRTKLQGLMCQLRPEVTELHLRVRNRALLAQKYLDKWAEDFAANAAQALQWCDRAHDEAAYVGVALDLLMAIQTQGAEAKIENLHSWTLREIARGAQFPCRSTSNASRCAHESELKAHAEILDLYQWCTDL